MPGRNIGKSLEQSIIEHSFNNESVYYIKTLPHTNPHDIEYEIDKYKIQTIDGKTINRNISIKTTKGNSVNCSDAAIFIEELNKSIDTKTRSDMIIFRWERINCTDVKLEYYRINLITAYKHGLFYNKNHEKINLITACKHGLFYNEEINLKSYL